MESETPESSGVKGSDAKFVHNLEENFREADSGNPDTDRELRRIAAQVAGAADGVDQESEDPGAPVEFPKTIPRIECQRLCRRFDGYLRGWFRNGLPCVVAAEFKRRFKKRTGYSWRHVDDVFPAFQRWSTNFRFKRTRLGRSTCVVITPRYRALIISTAEVRRRLIGAIRNHAAKSGSVHVDRKFLENFHGRYGLPPEQIFYAWRTLRRLDGLVCRWKGRGNGENFYVQTPRAAAVKTQKRQAGGRAVVSFSHPESASGISPLTGERSENSGYAADSQAGSSGSLRSQPGGVGEGSAPGVARGRGGTLRDRGGTPNRSPGDDFQKPCGAPGRGATGPKPATNDGAFRRWKPARPPLHVCDRWIAAARIRRKANFLAFGPILFGHVEREGVRFSAAHAVNFADDALRAGFVDAQICAAYRAGLEKSHAAAMREREDCGIENVWLPREPSQTVSLAWEILRADSRTDEERWSAFFRGEVAPQLRATSTRAETGAAVNSRVSPTAAEAQRARRAPAPEPARKASPPDPIAAMKKRAEKLPDTAPALVKFQAKQHATFEAHLLARGLTLDSLLKLSRAEQQKFVREALAAQRASSQTPPFANE